MSGQAEDAPLIVTAQLPAELHRWATRLRDAHFPPERNFLEAHVTLFHAIPPMCESELRECLKTLASEFAPVPARVLGVVSLGRGTAIGLESAAMLDIRDMIADRFHGMLTGQDQHRPRLHVTIQNKVSPQEAKALQSEIALVVEPRSFEFKGLQLFAYRGGPWESIADFAFRGKAVG